MWSVANSNKHVEVLVDQTHEQEPRVAKYDGNVVLIQNKGLSARCAMGLEKLSHSSKPSMDPPEADWVLALAILYHSACSDLSEA